LTTNCPLPSFIQTLATLLFLLPVPYDRPNLSITGCLLISGIVADDDGSVALETSSSTVVAGETAACYNK
jgi:hypothetical protein